MFSNPTLQQSRTTAAPAPSPVLDRRDSAILKTLAIVSLVLHNFFHAVSPAQQNEFTFNAGRFGVLLHTLAQPQFAVQALFSFFGHFGVQVFIFLSAYGLAKTHWDTSEPWSTFMLGRIRKLYPAFGLVVLPWFIVACIQYGAAIVVKKIGLQIALMFVGLSTFLPGAGLPPIGSWWFIPFIIEFYALWPLLRWYSRRFGVGGLIALSIVSITAVHWANPLLEPVQINLLETPIGRMPSICIGIAAARYGLRIPAWLAALSVPTLLLASRYVGFWGLATSSALVLWLWSYLQTRDTLRRFRWLQRMSEYVLVVFLVNCIVRDHLAPLATTPVLQFSLAAADLLISFAIAALLQPFLESRPPAKRAPATA